MNEHRYDIGTALAGLVFIALGIAFLFDRLDAIDLRPGVVLAVGVIGLGVAAVARSMAGARR